MPIIGSWALHTDIHTVDTGIVAHMLVNLSYTDLDKARVKHWVGQMTQDLLLTC